MCYQPKRCQMSDQTAALEKEKEREGNAYDHRDAFFMGNFGNCLKVWYVVARVANSLQVDGLGTIINGSSEILWLVTLDKLGVDSQTGEEDLELVVRAAIQVTGRHNVITRMGQSRNGHELSRLARGSSNSSNTTLESGDTLFKDIDRGLIVVWGSWSGTWWSRVE